MLKLEFKRKRTLSPPTWPRTRSLVVLATALAVFSGLFLMRTQAFGLDTPDEVNEKPVALVNGFPIYPSDLRCAVEASLARRHSSIDGPESDNSATLNHLIDIELLYQESLKHRFPGLVEESEELFEREIHNAGGLEKFRSTLMCNGMSLAQFRKSIFRNASIKRLLNKEVYSRINIDEKEIKEYYDRNIANLKIPESVKLRQIFIRAPSSADENSLQEVENRARAIFKQAAEGSDFVVLARKYSEDPEGASAGGEMGVIFKGNLHKNFDSLVFSLSEGSVSEPVRSSNGYHIFQVISFSPASQRPLDEVRSRIVELIRRSKARKMISDLVSSLRTRAEILVMKD